MGEGALAYELQDALAREFEAENAGKFKYNQRLTYEWTYLLTSLYKLHQRDIDHTFQEYPELVEYAFELSSKMTELDDLVELIMPPPDSYDQPVPLPELVKKDKQLLRLKAMASDTYFAHNGLHETAWRAGRLETIAEIYDMFISKTFNPPDDIVLYAAPSDRRLVASVHEELGSIDPDHSNFHHDKAFRYNQEFVSDTNIPWYDLQKVHALFSLYDIEYRQFMGPLMGRNDADSFSRSKSFSSLNQQRYYTDLYNRTCYIDDLLNIAEQSNADSKSGPTPEYLLWSGRALTLAGALTEAHVLGELRDAICERGLQLSVEARQAFLREDHNPRVPRPENPKKFMITPNFSFDLVLQQHNNHGPMTRLNVEVKKSHRSEIYLNDTYVLSTQDETNYRGFTRQLRQICEAKIAYHRGERLTSDQKIALAAARQRISPHSVLDEYLTRAA